jgi:hypothetical protein
MRQLLTDDGAVIIADDNDNELVAYPRIVRFAPISGAAHCACGADLKASILRDAGGDVVEIGCPRCNRALAFIALGATTEPTPLSADAARRRRKEIARAMFAQDPPTETRQ